MKQILSFSAGVQAFLKGFTVFKQKGLRRYVYVPLIINILIFSVSFYFGFEFIQNKISHFEYTLPSFLNFFQTIFNYIVAFLKIILILITALAMLLLMGLAASVIANLIASPFHSFLAEKMDYKQTGYSPPSTPILKIVGQAFLREIHKLVYYLPRAIIAGILFAILYFVPLLNFFAPFILYAFGAWMLSFQYLDYAADNRQISLTKLKVLLKNNKSACLGFGAMCMIFTSIPIVNLIILPVCVGGAVILWCELIQKSEL